MTVRDFIKSLGGSTQVAAHLGIPMTTVDTWARRNSVPDWRMAKLAELALRKGVSMPARFAEAPSAAA